MPLSSEQFAEAVPPQSVETERAVLGAMLYDARATDRMLELLGEDDFYLEGHRFICRAIVDLRRRGQKIAHEAVSQWLRDHAENGSPATPDNNLLLLVGGALYVQETEDAALPDLASQFAQTVRDKSIQRQLIAAADRIMRDAYEPQEDISALLLESEARLEAVSQGAVQATGKDLPTMYDVIQRAVERRKQADATGQEVGYPCPLKGLGHHIARLMPGDFVVIGGESSLGKSVLGMQLACGLVKAGAAGVAFSLEMDEDSIAVRMFRAFQAGATGYPHTLEFLPYRQSHPDEVYGMWEATASEFMGAPFLLDDRTELTPRDIVAQCRRSRRALGGLDFVLVDYLHLMDDDRHTSDETPRYRNISRALKAIAKTQQVTMIAVAQFNKPAQESGRQRPTMYRLYGSSALMHDADKILLLYRPEKDDRDVVEVEIAKQRAGPAGGKVRMRLDVDRLWFVEDSAA